MLDADAGSYAEHGDQVTDQPAILIVDDDERNVRLLKAMLAPEKYRISSALNGDQGLREVSQERPDLILLDAMMPGMDGFEFCKIVKEDEKNRSVPLLMVTALTAKGDRVKAMEAGADDFLSKPVDKTELLIRVKSLLRMKSYHDRLRSHLREIEEKNEKLFQLEHMQEELTHMIVHDLNAPLSGILGTLQMVLLDKEKLSVEHQEWLTDAMHQSRYLASMIKNILEINKMEVGKLELDKRPADLIRITNDVIRIFKTKIKAKEITLSLSPSEILPPVFVDHDMIRRVIANLLDNAIRHTPAGEKIEIRIHCGAGEEGLCYSIRDGGKGLQTEYHEVIFDKYRQIQNRKHGAASGRSGLGLVFCKMAVEAHDGRIWVESPEHEKGTVFLFSIPVYPPTDIERDHHETQYCVDH